MGISTAWLIHRFILHRIYRAAHAARLGSFRSKSASPWPQIRTSPSVRPWVLVGALWVLITGCTTHVFHQPMAISTKSSVYQQVSETGNVVTATQRNRLFVFIPIISDPRNTWDKVLEDARQQHYPVLLDVQYRSKQNNFVWMFPPFFSADMELKGTAARLH